MKIKDYLACAPDGAILIGSWAVRPKYLNVEVYVQNSGKRG